jgi:hypothetical protein
MNYTVHAEVAKRRLARCIDASVERHLAEFKSDCARRVEDSLMEDICDAMLRYKRFMNHRFGKLGVLPSPLYQNGALE